MVRTSIGKQRACRQAQIWWNPFGPLTETSRSIREPAFHGAQHDFVPGMADACAEIPYNTSTRKASAAIDSICVRARRQPEGVLRGKKNTAKWRRRYERCAWFLIPSTAFPTGIHCRSKAARCQLLPRRILQRHARCSEVSCFAQIAAVEIELRL